MKRMLLTISFDGTAYHGWQIQENAITVQATLQSALQKLLGKKTGATGCSRTDAGVHAMRFCCHIDCDDSLPPQAFLKGLNSILPDDITVIGCKKVKDGFHARYDCKSKTYIYGMYLGTPSPFLSRYYLHLDLMPDLDAMKTFARTVIGTHDFYGFSSSGRSTQDTVRTITECRIRTAGNKIFFEITGNGFLYNMVRILAGTALAVGYGRLPVCCADSVFSARDRSLAGDTLPPQGLFLKKVSY